MNLPSLKIVRESAEISQEKLAEKAKVSTRTIQRIEKGESVKEKTASAIASSLGVSIDDLTVLPFEEKVGNPRLIGPERLTDSEHSIHSKLSTVPTVISLIVSIVVSSIIFSITFEGMLPALNSDSAGVRGMSVLLGFIAVLAYLLATVMLVAVSFRSSAFVMKQTLIKEITQKELMKLQSGMDEHIYAYVQERNRDLDNQEAKAVFAYIDQRNKPAVNIPGIGKEGSRSYALNPSLKDGLIIRFIGSTIFGSAPGLLLLTVYMKVGDILNSAL